MNGSDTVLAAALVATPIGLAWELYGYPRLKAWRDAPRECVHDLYREGDHSTRTERCRKCRHQRPITQRRCPKCREWSDDDAV